MLKLNVHLTELYRLVLFGCFCVLHSFLWLENKALPHAIKQQNAQTNWCSHLNTSETQMLQLRNTRHNELDAEKWYNTVVNKQLWIHIFGLAKNSFANESLVFFQEHSSGWLPTVGDTQCICSLLSLKSFDVFASVAFILHCCFHPADQNVCSKEIVPAWISNSSSSWSSYCA